MTHFFTVAPDWKIVPQQDRHSNFSGFYHFIGCTRFSAVSLSIQDEFSMRYWHILKWLNDSHVRQWDHHVDDRSIKSNFSVPFRVAKQSRRSHVKKDHKVNSFGRKRNCESSSLTFEKILLFGWLNQLSQM